jgi:hypothetical protein
MHWFSLVLIMQFSQDYLISRAVLFDPNRTNPEVVHVRLRTWVFAASFKQL